MAVAAAVAKHLTMASASIVVINVRAVVRAYAKEWYSIDYTTKNVLNNLHLYTAVMARPMKTLLRTTMTAPKLSYPAKNDGSSSLSKETAMWTMRFDAVPEA